MALGHGARRPHGQVLLLGEGRGGGPAVLLRGQALKSGGRLLLLARAGRGHGWLAAMGLVLSKRLEVGHGALCCLPSGQCRALGAVALQGHCLGVIKVLASRHRMASTKRMPTQRRYTMERTVRGCVFSGPSGPSLGMRVV